MTSLRREITELRTSISLLQSQQRQFSASPTANGSLVSHQGGRKRGIESVSPGDTSEIHRRNGHPGSVTSAFDDVSSRKSALFLPEALDPARRSTFLKRQIKRLLPPLPACEAIVDLYFKGTFHAGWMVIDEAAFKRACERNVQLLDSAEPEEATDLDWLCLYLLVLSIACRLGPRLALTSALPALDAQDIAILSEALGLASAEALSLDNLEPIVSVYRLQTLLLSTAYTLHIGGPEGQSGAAYERLDQAVTAAQNLRLDMIEDWQDLSLLGTSEHPLVQEFQTDDSRASWIRQTYRYLYYLDGVSRTNCRHSRLSQSPSLMIPNLSASVVDSSLATIAAKLAAIVRRHDDCQGDDADQLAKSTAIWAYDAELVELLHELPAFDDTTQPVSVQSSTWMALVLHDHIHNRRLRAHRPFSTNDAVSSLHSLACVDSAVRIIESRKAMIRLNNVVPRFADRWVFNAVLVLAMDAISRESTRADHSSSIRRALEIFQNRAIDKSTGPDPRLVTIQSILATVRSLRGRPSLVRPSERQAAASAVFDESESSFNGAPFGELPS